MWDAATGRQLLSLPGDPCRIEWIAFSPDGGRLASVSNGRTQNRKAEFNTVRVWDAATGRQLLSLPVKDGGWIVSATFSPDGRRLAAVGAIWARVWDAATGRAGHTPGALRRGTVACLLRGVQPGWEATRHRGEADREGVGYHGVA